MIAAALIIVITVAGWFAMPKIMLLVSGGGPLVGVGRRDPLHARVLRRALAAGRATSGAFERD